MLTVELTVSGVCALFVQIEEAQWLKFCDLLNDLLITGYKATLDATGDQPDDAVYYSVREATEKLRERGVPIPL